MIWGAVIGAGASLAGSLLGKKGGGAAKIRPMSSYSALGQVDFTPGTKRQAGSINARFDPQSQQFYDSLQSQASGLLSPQDFNTMFGQSLQQGVAPQIGGTYDNFQNFNLGTGGAQQLLAAQLGQQQGLFSGIGMAGIGAAFNGQQASQYTNPLFAQGAGMIGQDYSGLQQQQLGLMRDQARPEEERAVNAKFQNLFNRGQLGTTGGAQGIAQLASAQEGADIQRQLSSMQFAQGLQAQNSQIGQSLFGLGLQGLGQDQNQALALGQLGQGFLSQVPGLQQSVFQSQGAADQFGLSAAQSRMQAAQGLFGFGQTAQDASVSNATNRLNIAGNMQNQLNNQSQLALSAAGMQAQAGANAAAIPNQGNPFAAAVQGLAAGGAFDDINFGGLFGRGANQNAMAEASNRGLTGYSLAGGLT